VDGANQETDAFLPLDLFVVDTQRVKPLFFYQSGQIRADRETGRQKPDGLRIKSLVLMPIG
jgi:hypothetical protein